MKLPDQLRVFEAFVNEAEEYPIVCLGVYEGWAGSGAFEPAGAKQLSHDSHSWQEF